MEKEEVDEGADADKDDPPEEPCEEGVRAAARPVDEEDFGRGEDGEESKGEQAGD